MCGISGIVLAQPCERSLQESIASITRRLVHRGPDDFGTWVDSTVGCALGHQRLSILELSAAGHQPMHSACDRFVMVLNGEIYNHRELRETIDAIDGPRYWRGSSDTETLLAGITLWGLESTLHRTVGMFSIALWDKKTSTLQLARDRLGEKPLYYGWVGQGPERALVFGSELKALKAYPGFSAPVCRQALAQYMRFMYVPAPRSIYQGIYKLEPGCLMTVLPGGAGREPIKPLRPGEVHGGLSIKRWWSLADAVESGANDTVASEEEGLRLLEERLIAAVGLQAVADVPVGAFLSGGIDSSTIVALMQAQSASPVSTFTIRFEEPGYDESPHALAVARHLGTRHQEMPVTSQIAHAVIPQLSSMYDEPFADSSQIPTHLVCRAARQQVTVALSGDAGDELFGGYNRYFWAPRVWGRLGAVPYPLRQFFAGAMGALPAGSLDSLAHTLGVVRPGEKMQKLAGALSGTSSFEEFYRKLLSEWKVPSDVVLDAHGEPAIEPASLIDEPVPPFVSESAPLSMMYRDSISYLPDDIFCKVDRASMAMGLEVRVPFVDHRVVELAWRLPLHMKIRDNEGKWALRQVLYNYVPRELVERPKSGFSIPLGQWLRGALRDWAESLLSESRLRAEGYFQPLPVRRRWQEHLSGRRDHTASLWSVLMFQAWLESER